MDGTTHRYDGLPDAGARLASDVAGAMARARRDRGPGFRSAPALAAELAGLLRGARADDLADALCQLAADLADAGGVTLLPTPTAYGARRDAPARTGGPSLAEVFARLAEPRGP